MPRPLIVGVAALAAIGIGAGAAFMMQEDPKLTYDAQTLGQQASAPGKAPTRKWSLSSEDIARQVVSGDEASSSRIEPLAYGTNGMMLMQVDDKGAVAVKESSGQPVWKVAGDFQQCESSADKSGWVCLYKQAPPDSSSTSSSTSTDQSTKLVRVDNNGRVTISQNVTEGQKLWRDPNHALWLLSGLPWMPGGSDGGADGESGSDDVPRLGGSTSGGDGAAINVGITKLDDHGSKLWSYGQNVSVASDALRAEGLAALPVFTVDGTTYVTGVQNSSGKGVALDSQGKPTDKADKPVLANDHGRRITSNGKDGYDDHGDGMKAGMTNLVSPMKADTGDVPLYNIVGNEIQKLDGDGTGISWKATAAEAGVTAYCNKVTVAASGSTAWFFDDKGKELWSGALTGSPQFCWGGKQLVSFDSSSGTMEARSLDSSASTAAWSADLGQGDASAHAQQLFPSSSANGIIATGSSDISFWGP